MDVLDEACGKVFVGEDSQPVFGSGMVRLKMTFVSSAVDDVGEEGDVVRVGVAVPFKGQEYCSAFWPCVSNAESLSAIAFPITPPITPDATAIISP